MSAGPKEEVKKAGLRIRTDSQLYAITQALNFSGWERKDERISERCKSCHKGCAALTD